MYIYSHKSKVQSVSGTIPRNFLSNIHSKNKMQSLSVLFEQLIKLTIIYLEFHWFRYLYHFICIYLFQRSRLKIKKKTILNFREKKKRTAVWCLIVKVLVFMSKHPGGQEAESDLPPANITHQLWPFNYCCCSYSVCVNSDQAFISSSHCRKDFSQLRYRNPGKSITIRGVIYR